MAGSAAAHMMEGKASSTENAVPPMTLSVMNLQYSHTQNFLEKMFQPDESALLENVTFSANSGELMAILAPRDAERR